MDESKTPTLPTESNLVKHAKRELQAAGMYSDDMNYGAGTIANNVLEVITLISKQGHSGGSMEQFLLVFNKLIAFENIAPLTNDPAEWVDMSSFGGPGPMHYQGLRNSSAFSADGGKTYWLISDRVDGQSFPPAFRISKEVAPTGAHPTRF